MISDVVIVGITKDNLKRGFREFDVDSTDALSGRTMHSLIKVRLWTYEDYSRLNKIKQNTTVAIRGRLEVDEEYGLYVLAESIFPCS